MNENENKLKAIFFVKKASKSRRCDIQYMWDDLLAEHGRQTRIKHVVIYYSIGSLKLLCIKHDGIVFGYVVEYFEILP